MDNLIWLPHPYNQIHSQIFYNLKEKKIIGYYEHINDVKVCVYLPMEFTKPLTISHIHITYDKNSIEKAVLIAKNIIENYYNNIT